MKIKFKGCKNLIYDKDIIDIRHKLKALPSNLGAYWERPDYLLTGCDAKNVQFCSKKGRLNSKVSCLEGMGECDRYKEVNHFINIEED